MLSPPNADDESSGLAVPTAAIAKQKDPGDCSAEVLFGYNRNHEPPFSVEVCETVKDSHSRTPGPRHIDQPRPSLPGWVRARLLLQRSALVQRAAATSAALNDALYGKRDVAAVPTFQQPAAIWRRLIRSDGHGMRCLPASAT